MLLCGHPEELAGDATGAVTPSPPRWWCAGNTNPQADTRSRRAKWDHVMGMSHLERLRQPPSCSQEDRLYWGE